MAAKWPTSVATDADLYVAVNSLQTTLSTALGTGDTSVVLASATGFPTAGAVTCGNEVIYYTGVSGATLTGCTRGADGTTAAVHSIGVPVGAAIVAFHHNGLMAEIEAIETSLNLTANRAIATSASGRLVVALTTDTELGYVHGVTSAIQTQLNLLAPLASPTFTGTVTVPSLAATNGTNQLVLGTTRTVTVTAPIPATSSRTWTIPDIASDATFAALEGTQTFSGTKTFSAALTVNPATNQLVLGGVAAGRTVTVTAPQPATASRTVTVPDLGADYSLVGTQGAQTIAGAKTFSSAVIVGGNTTGDANYGTISSVSLGNYYEGTFTATFTGPFNSGALTLTYVRIGKTVTILFPAFRGTSVSATLFTATAAIPSNLRPTTTQYFPCQIEDATAFPTAPGFIVINSTGTIQVIKTDATNNFTGSGTAGVDVATSFTYVLA